MFGLSEEEALRPQAHDLQTIYEAGIAALVRVCVCACLVDWLSVLSDTLTALPYTLHVVSAVQPTGFEDVESACRLHRAVIRIAHAALVRCLCVVARRPRLRALSGASEGQGGVQGRGAWHG